uniref:Uncharacterized protein n=1 Tax=Glossina pallidipes TaxID=7398 RepID=A0A1A9ZJD0_GLOPL
MSYMMVHLPCNAAILSYANCSNYEDSATFRKIAFYTKDSSHYLFKEIVRHAIRVCQRTRPLAFGNPLHSFPEITVVLVDESPPFLFLNPDRRPLVLIQASPESGSQLAGVSSVGPPGSLDLFPELPDSCDFPQSDTQNFFDHAKPYNRTHSDMSILSCDTSLSVFPMVGYFPLHFCFLTFFFEQRHSDAEKLHMLRVECSNAPAVSNWFAKFRIDNSDPWQHGNRKRSAQWLDKDDYLFNIIDTVPITRIAASNLQEDAEVDDKEILIIDNLAMPQKTYGEHFGIHVEAPY